MNLSRIMMNMLTIMTKMLKIMMNMLRIMIIMLRILIIMLMLMMVFFRIMIIMLRIMNTMFRIKSNRWYVGWVKLLLLRIWQQELGCDGQADGLDQRIVRSWSVVWIKLVSKVISYLRDNSWPCLQSFQVTVQLRLLWSFLPGTVRHVLPAREAQKEHQEGEHLHCTFVRYVLQFYNLYDPLKDLQRKHAWAALCARICLKGSAWCGGVAQDVVGWHKIWWGGLNRVLEWYKPVKSWLTWHYC